MNKNRNATWSFIRPRFSIKQFSKINNCNREDKKTGTMQAVRWMRLTDKQSFVKDEL